MIQRSVFSLIGRTHDQQEVDYLEEADGNLIGYEFKWRKKQAKIPPAFQKSYPHAKFNLIDTENFESFLLDT